MIDFYYDKDPVIVDNIIYEFYPGKNFIGCYVSGVVDKNFSECSSDVIIPDNIEGCPVTEIGNLAFMYSKVTSVIIPSTVKVVLYNTFSECRFLKNVYFEGNGLTYIGTYTFALCTSLTNIYLPNSLCELGDSVFMGSGLVSIKIPDKVKSIPKRAFEECYSLKEVRLGKNIRTLHAQAFSSCERLSYLYIPENVKYITGSSIIERHNPIHLDFYHEPNHYTLAKNLDNSPKITKNFNKKYSSPPFNFGDNLD